MLFRSRNLSLIKGVFGEAEVSLEYNRTNRYECRWVDLGIERDSPSIFTKGIDRLHIPVAHGEGNFYAPDDSIDTIENNNLVVMRYLSPDGSSAKGEFPYNPNGSTNDISAISDRSGRFFGMMPHPERNILFTHRNDWTYIKEKMKREGKEYPHDGEGITLFNNAACYYK